MKEICLVLVTQYKDLDDLVAGIDEKQWYLGTPFFHWTIFDEVAHIAFFDHEALLAIENPGRFKERAKGVMEVILADGNWPAYTNPLLGPENPEALAFSDDIMIS